MKIPIIERRSAVDPEAYWFFGLFVFSVWILFAGLGGAALFEPDEGRNAEVAREILLLKDPVTPHYDFIPRLDKPVLFFDLVALSFKLFGVSEWAARLPSVLAALGCILLVYFFSRALFGTRAALWSGLVLVTSPEFFALSRIVILEMTLTLFMSIALCGFVLGQQPLGRNQKRAWFILVYPALGAATLVKGPVGFLLPGGVIFLYLLLSRRWSAIKEMELPLGIALLLVTAAPWYALAEFRNPGYLTHFLWNENVVRFATTHFHRSSPWYYFIVVLAAGFFPWTLVLPTAVANLRKYSGQDERLFLIVWAVLPLLFFSMSSSKLPHYILFVYPPVAVIVGTTMADLLSQASLKTFSLVSLPGLAFVLLALVTTIVTGRPDILPPGIQPYVQLTFPTVPIPLLAGSMLVVVFGPVAVRNTLWKKSLIFYAAVAGSFAIFISTAIPVIKEVSLHRSSKQLVDKAASFVGAEDQLVLYGGYPSSLPFYFNVQRSIWVVWSGKKSKVLGSDYVATKQPRPAQGYGQVLFTEEEFAEVWKGSRVRYVMFVDAGAVARLQQLLGEPLKVIVELHDTVVVESRRAAPDVTT